MPSLFQRWFRRRKVLTPEDVARQLQESPIFANVPAEDLLAMATQGQLVHLDEGTTVIREGDEGDFYYVLLDGKASVLRRPSKNEAKQVVAELVPVTGFGEEALISNATRNATVLMETDGLVLKVAKPVFTDRVSDCLVTWISQVDAARKVAAGEATWLDVREEGEFVRSHLPDAASAPLPQLRAKMAELDRKITYICYCDNGRRSATAAFLLRQAGFQVLVLQGGLQRIERSFSRR